MQQYMINTQALKRECEASLDYKHIAALLWYTVKLHCKFLSAIKGIVHPK